MKRVFLLLLNLLICCQLASAQNQLDKQRLDSLVIEHFYQNIQFFPEKTRIEFNYDADNNMILQEGHTFFEEEWNITDRKEFMYHPDGSTSEFIDYARNVLFWFPVAKTNFEYNEAGQLIEQQNCFRDQSESEWDCLFRIVNSYNDLGLREMWTVYRSDSLFAPWTLDSRSIYFYNEDWVLEGFNHSSWNNSQMFWSDYTSRETISYLPGQGSISIWERTNSATTEWINWHKSELTVDAYGNELQFSRYDWNTTIDDWEGVSRIAVTYDTNVLKDDLISPTLDWFLGFDFSKAVSKPTGYLDYEWDEDTNDWFLSESGTYYYSDVLISSISQISADIPKVYPNPVIDNLYIQMLNPETYLFELFDLNGRIVLSQKLTSERSVSLNDLKGGLYLYTIENENNLYSGQIIKL